MVAWGQEKGRKEELQRVLGKLLEVTEMFIILIVVIIYYGIYIIYIDTYVCVYTYIYVYTHTHLTNCIF